MRSSSAPDHRPIGTGLERTVAHCTWATARLYVNGASQPSLVVTDLKNGVSAGKIALWARISTEAYFSAL